MACLIQAERQRMDRRPDRCGLGRSYGWAISGLAVNNVAPARPSELLRGS